MEPDNKALCWFFVCSLRLVLFLKILYTLLLFCETDVKIVWSERVYVLLVSFVGVSLVHCRYMLVRKNVQIKNKDWETSYNCFQQHK